MTGSKPFQIDLGSLRSKNKAADESQMQTVEAISEDLGFIAREAEASGKRGRPASPRTGQLHAKVLPDVSSGIASEARRRGVQQGVIIEEAWALYVARLLD